MQLLWGIINVQSTSRIKKINDGDTNSAPDLC